MFENNMAISAREQRLQERLEVGISTADCYISRNYLIKLSQNEIVPIDETYCNDSSLRLYRIERFVFDKNENVNDKLVSVYSALHELEGNAILLICGNEDGNEFYLGSYSKQQSAALCGDILEKGLQGNFPGSFAKKLSTSESSTLLRSRIREDDASRRSISSVSLVPSMRDDDKEKFVQGIEKFIDIQIMFSELFLKDAFTLFDELFLIFHLLLGEVSLYLITRMIGLDDIKPVFGWSGILVGP